MKTKPFLSSALLLLFAILLSLAIGSVFISPSEIWQVVLGRGTDTATSILWKIRLPRTVLVALPVVMQFESFNQGNSVVRIFSMNGLLVRALPVTIVKGKNQLQIAIDSRWPSGTYIFQLSYAKGGIAASGKVIIQ